MPKQNYIKTNTLIFANNACQAIFDMAGIEFTLSEKSFKEGTFSSSRKMIVYIYFSGTIQGEYIFSIDETLAAALIGMPDSDIKEIRGDYTDFLKELLNLSVSQSIVELEKSFGNLTFSSSTVVYGEIKFPEVRSGTVSILGLNSEIECGFSLDLAELKMGCEFGKALRDIERKTLEINEANKNIKNILELVPSGLVAIDSNFKILPGHSKSTALVVGHNKDKEIVGLNIVDFLCLKIKDYEELLIWLDTVFKNFGQISFENLISQCNQNEVNNKYGKTLKLSWLPVISYKKKELEKLLAIIEDISENARLYDDLNRINIQISHLLEVTRAMAKSKNKIMASATALIHLLSLLEKIDIKQAIVNIFHQSGDILNAYYLWKDGEPIENPLPYIISPEKNSYLKTISDNLITEGILIIIIKSNERIFAVLEIECYASYDGGLIESYRKFIEGIALSLALTMEHIEAEENNRLASIGSMAASIAHDLKNSIGIIIGYSEMAVDDTISADIRKEYLNIISKEASQMLNMAYEILDFCKSEINLNLIEIDSEEYIMDLSRTLSPIFKNNNILFEHNVDYKGLLKIDADRIRRVIFNLATNARDALIGANTKEAKFKIEIKKEKSGVLFQAYDNGPGIPEHIKSTIFEPFVTYGKSHGIGLGMAIVKKIINAHGGNITFVTQKNKGTIFNIFIPIEEEIFNKNYKKLKDEKNECLEFKIGREQFNILLAEDNITNQKLILKFINKIGYKADVVGDGNEAIFALENICYDIVLMDIQMPYMDGFEATKIIRNSESKVLNHKIPIIAMTGYSMKEDIEKCIETGMNDYISKPIKIEKLSQILDKYLSLS